MIGDPMPLGDFIEQIRPAMDAATPDQWQAALERMYRPKRGPFKTWRARRKVRRLVIVINAGPKRTGVTP